MPKKKRSTSIDFSAAEDFLSGMDFGIDLNFNTDYSGGYFDDVGDDINTSRNLSKLNELIAKRKGKGPKIDYALNSIIENTVRIVSNQENFFTHKGEFYYKNKDNVKEGVPYHIRYTKDMREHYITGFGYNKLSRILLPKKKKTNFAIYQSLNKQSPMLLKTNKTLPNNSDYQKGYYQRYFAKKANEKHRAPFEISKEDHTKSPALYSYYELTWRISGDKQMVKDSNDNSINSAERTMPGIGKILPDYQFYRVDEKKSPKEAVEDRLFGV